MQPNIDSPVSGARAIKALFFAQMVLSPVLAAIAYLVPVAADWGAFKYAPAILWLAMLFQCLFTFHWRGLWFLLGPAVAAVAIVAFLTVAPAVPKLAARSVPDDPPSPKSAVPGGASTHPAGKLMITQNPDGTFTIQKDPPSRKSTDPEVAQGLVIPAQVVVPMTPPLTRPRPASAAQRPQQSDTPIQ